MAWSCRIIRTSPRLWPPKVAITNLQKKNGPKSKFTTCIQTTGFGGASRSTQSPLQKVSKNLIRRRQKRTCTSSFRRSESPVQRRSRSQHFKGHLHASDEARPLDPHSRGGAAAEVRKVALACTSLYAQGHPSSSHSQVVGAHHRPPVR